MANEEGKFTFLTGVWFFILITSFLTFLVWISGGFNVIEALYADNRPPTSHAVPDPEPVWEDPEPPTPDVWSCFWDPTMNENWHDDILCTNGGQSERPLLLTDWGFVTKDDMLAEARNYESYLNSR